MLVYVTNHNTVLEDLTQEGTFPALIVNRLPVREEKLVPKVAPLFFGR